MKKTDEKWMREAILQAQKAAENNEVPVGAVVVFEDKLLATGGNSPITSCDPTAHAEIRALRSAGQQLGNYRLVGTSLYVTLEPCLMCMGAIIQARISRLIFGAYDTKAGAVVSTLRFDQLSTLNHKILVSDGVLEEECASLLKSFFAEKRRIKKQRS